MRIIGLPSISERPFKGADGPTIGGRDRGTQEAIEAALPEDADLADRV
jgi:hypothetical protein